MPPWLLVWLGRWLSGERFRKATSRDYRYQFAGLLFFAVFMIVCMQFGQRFLDHASALSIWVAATVAMAIFFFTTLAWARLVPAGVSLVLGIIAWVVFALLMLHAQHVL